MKDVIALSAILKKVNVTKTILPHYSFSLLWVELYTKFFSDKNGLLSKGMSEKIEKSGLCYQHLQLSYERNAEDGIQVLFREKFNGSVRTPKSKKIIFSVAQHFKG